MTKHILLCDDEPHILRAAEYKFKRSGYDVACAFDGQEGWEEIQKRRPDVVVTDCQMPRLDGLGLAKLIHENPETCDIPVFMLTAKGFEISSEQAREQYGILEVLAKPFSPRELFQRVDSLFATADAGAVVVS